MIVQAAHLQGTAAEVATDRRDAFVADVELGILVVLVDAEVCFPDFGGARRVDIAVDVGGLVLLLAVAVEVCANAEYPCISGVARGGGDGGSGFG